jgi:septum formation protein
MTSPKGVSPIASNRPKTASFLVLASESPRRKALLAQAGIVPDAIVPPEIDERPYKQWTPAYNAFYFAAAKAARVASMWNGPPAVVLAADTVVACGRRMLPKAATDDDVRQCLALLSGRRHQVITAITVFGLDAKARHRSVLTRVTFKRLSTEEIEAYVRCGEGVGKAGGYAIQGRAETFVRQINGSWSNVVGLPLLETVALLKGCGVAFS